MGLGLALSRQTVRDHGGDLWAEPPAAAGGARFYIRLPR
jgi:signal transduction histidine kinase